MPPIVTDSRKPRVVTREAQPASLLARLERWGAPVPPEYGQLLPRFLASRRDDLRHLLSPLLLLLLIFFAVFTLTDVLIYTAEILPLLALRAVLVGTYLVAWVGRKKLLASQQIYGLFSVVVSITTIVISLMLAFNHEPTGLYISVLFCAIPMIAAVFPMPRFWYVLNVAVLVLAYALAMLAVGLILERNVIQMVAAIFGGAVINTWVHGYIDNRRWENFLTYVRSEELGVRLQGELALARRIQHGLLQPGAPGWSRVDMHCWSEAAREVGGDFYAYQRTEAGRVGLAVGDVSGKGLPAALLMGTSLAYLRAVVADAASPGDLLARLDQALVETTRATRQNCALCYADLSGGNLRVANAGGIPPLLRRADGQVGWIEAGGLPLGTGLGGLGYRDVQAELEPGDLLVLVSDGIVEAMDEAGGMFGFERLEAAVSGCDSSSAFIFVAELRDALAGFMGLAEAHDDMTIVALRVG